MNTAVAAKPESEVAIICEACHYLVPQFARRPLKREDDLRSDIFRCPTCDTTYQVTVERILRTNLTEQQLDVVRNKNR